MHRYIEIIICIVLIWGTYYRRQGSSTINLGGQSMESFND